MFSFKKTSVLVGASWLLLKKKKNVWSYLFFPVREPEHHKPIRSPVLLIWTQSWTEWALFLPQTPEKRKSKTWRILFAIILKLKQIKNKIISKDEEEQVNLVALAFLWYKINSLIPYPSQYRQGWMTRLDFVSQSFIVSIMVNQK